ncbi:deoxynucleoside kinase, partial [Clostridium perfringens]
NVPEDREYVLNLIDEKLSELENNK